MVDSHEAVTREPTPQERRQILLAEYQEVCKSHAGITDFRAKLVTVGLFLSEFRQIDVCKQLQNHAAWLGAARLVRPGGVGRESL